MTRRRLAALLLALALVGSACNLQRAGESQQADEGSVKVGEGVELPEEATPAPVATAGSTSAGRKTTTPSAATPRPTVPPAGGGADPASFARDNSPTGTNALLYLRRSVPKLVIEIGAVQGKQPLPDALNVLEQRVREVVDKPAGVEIRVTKTFAPTSDTYTYDEMNALEKQHRTLFTNKSQAVLYLLFLNGGRDPGGAAGVAYKASTAAIFPDTYRSVTSTSSASLEKTVLVHEVGHLLSLVNIGYTSPRDHCDCDPKRGGGHHSKNAASVMHWKSEDVDYLTSFVGAGPPNQFDADDKADLADRREGRL